MEPEKTNQTAQHKKVGIGIAVVAVLAILGITIASNKKSSDDTTVATDSGTTSATVATTAATTTTAPTSTGTAEYKDGTYTATGSYMSPGGEDHIAVTVTLDKDIITSASVTPEPGDNTSARYQQMFADNYKPYVIGMDITKLNVQKVSGSSLTSKGFNDAIAQIQTQAKA